MKIKNKNGKEKLGKKGVFFTLISIMIVATLFLWFNGRQYASNVDTIPVTSERISRANDFVNDVNTHYIDTFSTVATYTALSAIITYEKERGAFLSYDDLQCALKTVPAYGIMLNGTWTDQSSDIYFTTTPNLAQNPNPQSNFISFGGQNSASQSFSPSSSGNLQSATFSVKWAMPPWGNIIVELRDSACGKPGPNVIDSAVITSFIDFLPHTVTAIFSSNPYLVSGREYYFVFSSTGSQSSGVRIDKGNAYPQGQAYKTGTYPISFYLDSKLSSPIIGNNYLSAKLQELANLSKDIYFYNTSFYIIDYSIYQDNQSGPWAVIAEANVNYTVNTTIAAWLANISVKSKVPIVGIEDPYIAIKTNGLYTNKIVNSFEGITTDYLTNSKLWGYGNFTNMLKYKAYKPDPNAPNYLMRFYDNMSASSCCGIESLIYFDDYNVNMSYIDYCYWSNICPGSQPGLNVSLYTVDELSIPPFNFLIEPYHAVQYQISQNTTFYTNDSTGWA